MTEHRHQPPPQGSNGPQQSQSGPPHRSFQARGQYGRKPVTFDIDGTEFTSRAMVPGTVLVEHTKALLSDNEAIATAELLAMWEDVFDTEQPIYARGDDGEVLYRDGEPVVVAESEYDRFRSYVDDPANEVDLQLLGEILYWVLGQLAERPTNAPQPSQPGLSATGPTSGSASPGQAATPTPSTSGR